LTKIVNSYETPEFAKYMSVARDWYKKGYIRQDVISNKRASNNPDEKAGRYFSGFTGAAPNAAANLTKAWGYDVVVVPTSETYLQPGLFAATMTAVSATSKHPERALMLVELMNTDKELYNLLGLGIEGKHYNMVKEGVIELVPDSKYNPANHWMFGSEFNLYVTNGLPEDIWEQQKKLNESAKMNVLETFKVNNENVIDRVKQIQAIIVEYSPAVASGAIDGEAKLKEMNEKLYQAGLAEVHADDLRQIQEWQAKQ
jgi:putative aldouronate transport system substrate-binding protein